MATVSTRSRAAGIAVASCVFVMAAAPVHAAVSKSERACAVALGKSVLKLAKTAATGIAQCRLNDITGTAPGMCPNAANLSAIATTSAAVVAAAQSKCRSTCSVSTGVECIADSLCPPLVTPSSGTPEHCSASAAAAFDMRHLGFPGPYCETAVGHPLLEPADIGGCAADIAETAASKLVDAVFGSLNNASSISSAAEGCLHAITGGAVKLATTVLKGVAKCRNAILGNASGNPASCQASDPKLVAKSAKFEAKLDAAIDANCDLNSILELDLCGNGIGQTLTVADAKACLKAAAREVSDSNVAPALRSYAPISVIDAAYPPAARCGDGIINQLPNSQALLGEECDTTSDAACPGACLPPGDAFECTCGNRPRMRMFVDFSQTDADAGWTGISHQQSASGLSGYITELQNCDCSAFDGPTCIGTSTDPVCDLKGLQLPTCSWEPFSGTRCDSRGNGNGADEDKDCAVCDSWSANAGTWCVDERGCDAQCYDPSGAVTGPCENQTDCAPGDVCRGQCDRNQSCLVIPNGAPLPVSAAGAAVCAVQKFRTDATGTRNVITGEHEVNYRLFSVIHLGESTSRPCPVCGGFCVGGANDLEICHGRCSESGDACRFNEDCPPSETCSRTSPDCPGAGAFCQLDLVCGADPSTPSAGRTCHIEWEHPSFGTLSSECAPSPLKNITGLGFQVDYLTGPLSTPATTGAISFPATYPCTQPGLELYQCPCPAQLKPNACAPACDAAGPNFGAGCATGNTAGQGTRCAGGGNDGKLCDQDSDCSPGTCSQNPEHCVGDPAYERFACTTNADCGLGSCQDACPGGRCTQLCLASVSDPDEGFCAAGPPVTHCESPLFAYKACSLAAATSSSCSATCSVSATPCTSKAQCPSGETCAGPCKSREDCEAGGDGILGTSDDKEGAGACLAYERSCYLDPITGEGGTTLNGNGDPEHESTVAAYCYTATTNPGVNAASGFPGPGRTRQKGFNITNGFASIP